MNYIVDDIGLVVDAVRATWSTLASTQILINSKAITMDGEGAPPYYMYGHRREIAARLLKKQTQGAPEKYRKYPLIALRLDTSERIVGSVSHFNLNIAIVHATQVQYNAEERYTNVFKPILYPLYELFFTKLREFGLFMWTGDLIVPEHTKIDRPFYGTAATEGNIKSVFADPLDAIEIVDLRISKRNKGIC